MHRIKQLQSLLKEQHIKVFLLPNSDEFQNEYLPDYSKRIEWLTGFTGSAATLIITVDRCIFITDSRYTLQAERELDLTQIDICNITPWQWLRNNDISELWYDPVLHTEIQLLSYIEAGILLQEVKHNPIDILWRPQFIPSPIIDHSPYAGIKSFDKCKSVAMEIPFFITAPDSICWLLNIRGQDISHTPLVLSYAILYPAGNVDLFLSNKPNFNIGEHVTIHSMFELSQVLHELDKVAYDPKNTVVKFLHLVGSTSLIKRKDPCQLAKACKNPTEIADLERAHQRDGIAVTKFLYWLQNNQWTEQSAADKLLQYRQEQELFQDLSFPTISAFAENAAVIHYTKCTDEPIAGNNFYLVDSGGQYLDGTTDVTRTVAIGDISAEQRRNYTLVLKGHIALARAIFPKGTTGRQLDVLARQYLWQTYQNYNHGTGHGVGYYLGVHEGPQSLSNDVVLQVGMILSNEPGFYQEGQYGIRIESLMQVVEKNEQYLGFSILTCVPIEVKAINRSLLTVEEMNWLNDYNLTVYNSIGAKLDDNIKKWMMNNTL